MQSMMLSEMHALRCVQGVFAAPLFLCADVGQAADCAVTHQYLVLPCVLCFHLLYSVTTAT
jgi:hypothetical protein